MTTEEQIEMRRRLRGGAEDVPMEDDLYDTTKMAPEETAVASKGDAAAYSAAAKKGGALGDAATLASMYAINPYVGGAATGLMALDKVAAARQKDREAKAAAANARIGAIQQQIGSMTQAAQGLSI